jgi:hypothetical protein
MEDMGKADNVEAEQATILHIDMDAFFASVAAQIQRGI